MTHDDDHAEHLRIHANVLTELRSYDAGYRRGMATATTRWTLHTIAASGFTFLAGLLLGTLIGGML